MAKTIKRSLTYNGEPVYSFWEDRSRSLRECRKSFYHDGFEPIIDRLKSVLPEDTRQRRFLQLAYVTLLEEFRRNQLFFIEQMDERDQPSLKARLREQISEFTDEMLDALPRSSVTLVDSPAR